MSDWLSIRKEVSPRVRWTLAFVSWGFLVALWIVLTHWEILPPFSLPKPMGVIRAFARLWTEYVGKRLSELVADCAGVLLVRGGGDPVGHPDGQLSLAV